MWYKIERSGKIAPPPPFSTPGKTMEFDQGPKIRICTKHSLYQTMNEEFSVCNIYSVVITA